MSAPAVSVIMPLYNSARFVRAAVESVRAQTFRDFELLVVDDASTDDGVAVVASIQDPQIRLFRQTEQRGPAAARNRALAEARGEFIAFFDSDDVAFADWLADTTAILSAQSDCDLVGAWLETIDEQGAPTGSRNAYDDRPEKIAPTMLFANCLSTSTLLIRRRCLESQRFDESLAVASDYDLWARLGTSHRVFILRKILGQYRVHPKNLTHRQEALRGECLRHIARSQLERLGVSPSDDELSLHLRMVRFTFGTSKETVLSVENWLGKLDEANVKTAVYVQPIFREILGERWFAVCHSACQHGFWTWHRFHRSRLAEWFAPSARQRRRFFYLCLRGALKKLLLPSKPCAE